MCSRDVLTVVSTLKIVHDWYLTRKAFFSKHLVHQQPQVMHLVVVARHKDHSVIAQ